MTTNMPHIQRCRELLYELGTSIPYTAPEVLEARVLTTLAEICNILDPQAKMMHALIRRGRDAERKFPEELVEKWRKQAEDMQREISAHLMNSNLREYRMRLAAREYGLRRCATDLENWLHS